MVGIVVTIQIPKIIDKVFSDYDFNNLKKLFINYKKFEFQQGFFRWVASSNIIPEIDQYSCSLTYLAREAFNSTTLLPTYALFAHYEGESASLYKHKDDNACTYTLDLCLYQKYPWDLYVEGTPYTLYPNQALAYYGNNQEHWREEFPESKTNYVAMIFFHFAEPNHWYFQKGPNHINIIRSKITKDH